jgi:hypothetical protein
MTADNSKKYIGEWRNDLYHGHGKESWSDGSFFEGVFAQGKKNGNGTYVWPDHTTYSGEWVGNKMRG